MQLLRPRTIENRVIYTPIKPFVYFSPVDWLSRLLARPGVEAEMDAAWSKSKDSRADGVMRDIFDGEILRNFKGPNGRHFMLGNGEGRYVFSLSVDFFNPLGNKAAGKKISIGLISLVCLNLPPHLRYRSENMFLAGVIPGPKEPLLSDVNNFLAPLVDDFLKMWDPGIQLSRTDDHPLGRLVRCAIICVVCDLPAARKLAGFASSAHTHFCAICHCSLKTKGGGKAQGNLGEVAGKGTGNSKAERKARKAERKAKAQGKGRTSEAAGKGLNDTDYYSWERRNNLDCRKAAKHFRRAGPSTAAAESIVDQTGVRWSQLLRLPYFDPSRFVIVDAMHNLFLGLIHKHFTGILGIQLLPDKEKDKPVFQCNMSKDWSGFTQNGIASMKKVIRWLEHPMTAQLSTDDGMKLWLKKLSNERADVLKFICNEYSLAPIPFDPRKTHNFHRADHARAILQWVISLSPLRTTADYQSNL